MSSDMSLYRPSGFPARSGYNQEARLRSPALVAGFSISRFSYRPIIQSVEGDYLEPDLTLGSPVLCALVASVSTLNVKIQARWPFPRLRDPEIDLIRDNLVVSVNQFNSQKIAFPSVVARPSVNLSDDVRKVPRVVVSLKTERSRLAVI